MKLKLFIECVGKNHDAKIINTQTDATFDAKKANMLERFRSLKSLFQYINFDCQINKTGGCKDSSTAKMCCCSSCYYSAGYLKMIPDTDVKYYARRFYENHGFWKEGKGCVLPHQFRSIICLTHHCNDDRYKKNKTKHPGFKEGMMEIKHQLKRLRYKILWKEYGKE